MRDLHILLIIKCLFLLTSRIFKIKKVFFLIHLSYSPLVVENVRIDEYYYFANILDFSEPNFFFCNIDIFPRLNCL